MNMGSSRSKHNLPPNQAANGIGLDLFEANTHSFVVRVWLEETAQEAGRTTWRGHITHVPSGERRYLKNLNDIVTFIVPYFERMGVKFGVCWRVRQRVKRWKLFFRG
jgi:hypothetical protein